MRYLTFALGKGRLAKKTLELFEKIGITCEEMKDKDSRKLIFVTLMFPALISAPSNLFVYSNTAASLLFRTFSTISATASSNFP